MSITLYHIETDTIKASITQDKYCNGFNLIIYTHDRQVIKKGYYMSMKSAKQALNRFVKKEG